MTQLALVAGCLLYVVALWQIEAPADKVVFLDVGQGDAILLQTGTRQVLIDGGPDATVLQRLAEELPWFDRTIDVVVATHPDKDHIGGLVHVLERYDVGLVLLPDVAHTSKLQNAWLEHLKEEIANQTTQYRFAAAGQSLQLDAVSLEILHPKLDQQFGKKTNNGSVSTRVNFCQEDRRSVFFHERIVRPFGMVPSPPAGGEEQKAEDLGASRWTSENERGEEGGKAIRNSCLAVLLTGDAESVIERQLAAGYGSELDVDILKVGHHGSKTSTSEELLAVTTPKAVVISAGRDNQYGHPHPDVLARLKPYTIWRTDEQGSIRFRWHEQQWLTSTTLDK